MIGSVGSWRHDAILLARLQHRAQPGRVDLHNPRRLPRGRLQAGFGRLDEGGTIMLDCHRLLHTESPDTKPQRGAACADGAC